MSKINTIINMIINYVRENYDELMSMDPKDVVTQIMDAIREYEPLSKVYIKMFWNTISKYLSNPTLIMMELRKIDPELYNKLMNNTDWLNRFFYTLYVTLKNYIS